MATQHMATSTSFSPKLKNLWMSTKTRAQALFARLKKHSLKVLAVVAVLLAVVFGAAFFTKKPAQEPEVAAPAPLKVKTITIGKQDSSLETAGTVQNLSAVTLVAQTAGPIRKIYTSEGQTLKKGQSVISQETGYGTGNAAAIGAQVAEKNLAIAETTLNSTVQSVSKAREMADKNRENTEELRKISAASIDGTRKIVDTTKQVISKIEADIAATSDATIIQGLRQQLINYQNILVSSESQLRNIEYSTNTDKAPTKLADFAKDQVYISTQLQLDTAKLGKEISELSLRSARITASLATVRTPFAGTVEKVFVTQGQYVAPGTPVARLTGTTAKLCLVVPISGFSAASIDENASVSIDVDGRQELVPITHISSTPTNGQLYEVLVNLPESFANSVYEGQTLNVSLPTNQARIDKPGSQFVPLEAVFVTNTERYVYVYENGTAVRRLIKTNNIVGNDIEVTEGLNIGDQVIVDRRVFEGQKVEAIPDEKEVEERG